MQLAMHDMTMDNTNTVFNNKWQCNLPCMTCQCTIQTPCSITNELLNFPFHNRKQTLRTIRRIKLAQYIPYPKVIASAPVFFVQLLICCSVCHKVPEMTIKQFAACFGGDSVYWSAYMLIRTVSSQECLVSLAIDVQWNIALE